MVRTMKKGDILELDIIDLAFGGKGIAKVKIDDKDFVIFVDGALPGQKVEARIKLKKRRHAEAKILKVLSPSPDEVEIPYQLVPGAPWAKLPVEIQREYKQKQVFELFKKFAHVDAEKVFDTYVESPMVWEYRNKMEYSFGPTEEFFCEVGLEGSEGRPQKKWEHTGFGLGSKKRGQFWLVETLEKPSGLFDKDFEALIPELKTLAKSTGRPVYNTKTNEGFWRQLTVRKSFYEGEFLIDLVTTSGENTNDDIKSIESFFREKLGERFGGFFYTQSDSVGNPCNDYGSREFMGDGQDVLIEKINDLEFTISLDSFFQTNVKSAEKLYQKVLEYTEESFLPKAAKSQEPKINSSSDVILDLFCGTGTIGQIVAKSFPEKNITGVELIASAVEDAKKNVENNNLKNINFVCADVGKFLKEYKSEKNLTIVLDPPRAGIAPKTLQKVIDFKPSSMVYVSCNPATLARDTAVLQEQGYKLEKLSLVDQFPHTAHVECVSRFVKSSMNFR